MSNDIEATATELVGSVQLAIDEAAAQSASEARAAELTQTMMGRALTPGEHAELHAMIRRGIVPHESPGFSYAAQAGMSSPTRTFQLSRDWDTTEK